MAGFDDLQLMKRLEAKADELGFRIGRSKFAYDEWHSGGPDLLGLFPKDDEALPIYTRDAELFTGNFSQLSEFFAGIAWAREYDGLIHLSTSKARVKKEQGIRNKQLAKIIKDS